MNPKRHIAIVTPGFPVDEADTSCLPFLQLYLNELRTRDVKISVFTLHYPFTSKAYQWNGISVYPCNGRNRRVYRRLFLKSKLTRIFHKVHLENPIDFIHAMWLNETSVFAHSLSKKFGVKMIANGLGQDALPSNSYLKTIRKLDIPVTSISFFHQKFLLDQGISNVRVIPYGVAMEGEFEKSIDIVGVGSLIPLKNYAYFIELCGLLKKIKPHFKAVIIGEGPEYAKLNGLIEAHELTSNVSLLGNLSYNETQAYIQKSNVLLHTSTFEGHGMIMPEAQAVQTKVFAGNVGFAYQNDSIAKLTFDPQTDIQTLNDLLEQPKPAIKFHSIQTTVDQFLDVYEN